MTMGDNKTLKRILWGVAGLMALGTMAAQAADPAPPAVLVRMETSLGDMVLELNPAKAPITCENFLRYVEEGFYHNTIFHRVVKGFVIQGGGFTPEMEKKKTNPPIKNEWRNGLKNLRGTISMARLGGQPHSATSQFFISVRDNPALDQARDGAAYAVFGKIIEGLDVMDQIEAVRTTTHGRYQDVPAQPVIIKSVTRLEGQPRAIEAADAQPQEGDQKE